MSMMLFSGNANVTLTINIAKYLKLEIGKAHVGTFSDGETSVEILENVRGKDVFIIQSTCAPANDHLMELMSMADALRRSSAARITAVVPYFGYARQDRRVRSARVPITSKIVADMMTSVGINRILTVDLHADQIQGFFHMPVDNVYTTLLMRNDIAKHGYESSLIVSPDVGGVVRARAMSKELHHSEMAIIDKRRSGPNKSEVMHVIGDVSNRHCILIDDIVDTAGTLCGAAAELKKRGALSVRAYVTHPVFSGPAINNIMNSVFDEVVVTDTIPLTKEAQSCAKVRVLNLDEMLAKAIKCINDEESISMLLANK